MRSTGKENHRNKTKATCKNTHQKTTAAEAAAAELVFGSVEWTDDVMCKKRDIFVLCMGSGYHTIRVDMYEYANQLKLDEINKTEL